MSRTEYKNKFNSEHYERINISVPKGMKGIIKDLAAQKDLSMNKYFLELVIKDRESMFNNMQLAEKNREKILTIKKKAPKGYDVLLKDGRVFYCKTKLDIRKLLSQNLVQDSQSLAQDT